LAVNATMVYGSHPECYDTDLNQYMLKDADPFGFNTLTYIREVTESKKLNTMQRPCIIISASGMANAGRIVHHINNNITKRKNTILFVGFCAEGTLGAYLKTHPKEVNLFGQRLPVNAEIKEMDSFSAHGDRHEMYDFFKNQTHLKKFFMVHGEYETQKAFKTYLEERKMNNIEIPTLGEEFEI